MSKKKKNEMSFLDHLEELRWHLLRALGAIIVLAIAAFIFHDIIFDKIILAPKTPDFFTNRMLCAFSEIVNAPTLCINSNPFKIINIQMAGQFTTHIMVSIIAGVILAFPYIFFEFWSFVKPALYSKEKGYAGGAVFYSSLLFLLGVLFGFYVITPLSVHFLGSYTVSSQVENQIDLTSYISTVAKVVLASGIVFELPVLVFFLTKIGLITPSFLRQYRKHSIVVILLLSAIITPPDIFSQVLVCFPLLFLYEIGIIISKRVLAKEKARLEED
jgi:sec-independent protein translocase protein TatC